MYKDGDKIDAPMLPLNLLDALRSFEGNKNLHEILGIEFADSYFKLKMEEWNNFMQYFTEWEHTNALDV